MRTALFVATALMLSVGTSAGAAEPSPIRIAQASTDTSAAPATAAPAAPPAATTPTAPAAAAAPAAPAAAPAAPAAAAPPQKLVGVAAWGQLIGNSISGTSDGKPLTEYYAPDGTAKSMTGNDISTGNWMLTGEVICFKYTDEPKPECYKLEVSGDTATMYDEKGSGTRYQILKGNPKGL
jgi:hypothetical protein